MDSVFAGCESADSVSPLDTGLTGRYRMKRKSNGRRSSILKSTGTGFKDTGTLADLDPNQPMETAEIPSKKCRLRRVSFANTYLVKEIPRDTSSLWDQENQGFADPIPDPEPTPSITPQKDGAADCNIAGFDKLLTGPIQHPETETVPGDVMEMPFPNDSDDSVHASQVHISITDMSQTSCHGNFPTDMEDLKQPPPDDFYEGLGQKKADGMAFLQTLMTKPETQTKIFVPDKQFADKQTYHGVYNITNDTDYKTIVNTSINKYLPASTYQITPTVSMVTSSTRAPNSQRRSQALRPLAPLGVVGGSAVASVPSTPMNIFGIETLSDKRDGKSFLSSLFGNAEPSVDRERKSTEKQSTMRRDPSAFMNQISDLTSKSGFEDIDNAECTMELTDIVGNEVVANRDKKLLSVPTLSCARAISNYNNGTNPILTADCEECTMELTEVQPPQKNYSSSSGLPVRKDDRSALMDITSCIDISRDDQKAGETTKQMSTTRHYKEDEETGMMELTSCIGGIYRDGEKTRETTQQLSRTRNYGDDDKTAVMEMTSCIGGIYRDSDETEVIIRLRDMTRHHKDEDKTVTMGKAGDVLGQTNITRHYTEEGETGIMEMTGCLGGIIEGGDKTVEATRQTNITRHYSESGAMEMTSCIGGIYEDSEKTGEITKQTNITRQYKEGDKTGAMEMTSCIGGIYEDSEKTGEITKQTNITRQYKEGDKTGAMEMTSCIGGIYEACEKTGEITKQTNITRQYKEGDKTGAMEMTSCIGGIYKDSEKTGEITKQTNITRQYKEGDKTGAMEMTSCIGGIYEDCEKTGEITKQTNITRQYKEGDKTGAMEMTSCIGGIYEDCEKTGEITKQTNITRQYKEGDKIGAMEMTSCIGGIYEDCEKTGEITKQTNITRQYREGDKTGAMEMTSCIGGIYEDCEKTGEITKQTNITRQYKEGDKIGAMEMTSCIGGIYDDCEKTGEITKQTNITRQYKDGDKTGIMEMTNCAGGIYKDSDKTRELTKQMSRTRNYHAGDKTGDMELTSNLRSIYKDGNRRGEITGDMLTHRPYKDNSETVLMEMQSCNEGIFGDRNITGQIRKPQIDQPTDVDEVNDIAEIAREMNQSADIDVLCGGQTAVSHTDTDFRSSPGVDAVHKQESVKPRTQESAKPITQESSKPQTISQYQQHDREVEKAKLSPAKTSVEFNYGNVEKSPVTTTLKDSKTTVDDMGLLADLRADLENVDSTSNLDDVLHISHQGHFDIKTQTDSSRQFEIKSAGISSDIHKRGEQEIPTDMKEADVQQVTEATPTIVRPVLGTPLVAEHRDADVPSVEQPKEVTVSPVNLQIESDPTPEQLADVSDSNRKTVTQKLKRNLVHLEDLMSNVRSKFPRKSMGRKSLGYLDWKGNGDDKTRSFEDMHFVQETNTEGEMTSEVNVKNVLLDVPQNQPGKTGVENEALSTEDGMMLPPPVENEDAGGETTSWKLCEDSKFNTLELLANADFSLGGLLGEQLPTHPEALADMSSSQVELPPLPFEDHGPIQSERQVDPSVPGVTLVDGQVNSGDRSAKVDQSDLGSSLSQFQLSPLPLEDHGLIQSEKQVKPSIAENTEMDGQANMFSLPRHNRSAKMDQSDLGLSLSRSICDDGLGKSSLTVKRFCEMVGVHGVKVNHNRRSSCVPIVKIDPDDRRSLMEAKFIHKPACQIYVPPYTELLKDRQRREDGYSELVASLEKSPPQVFFDVLCSNNQQSSDIQTRAMNCYRACGKIVKTEWKDLNRNLALKYRATLKEGRRVLTQRLEETISTAEKVSDMLASANSELQELDKELEELSKDNPTRVEAGEESLLSEILGQKECELKEAERNLEEAELRNEEMAAELKKTEEELANRKRELEDLDNNTSVDRLRSKLQSLEDNVDTLLSLFEWNLEVVDMQEHFMHLKFLFLKETISLDVRLGDGKPEVDSVEIQPGNSDPSDDYMALAKSLVLGAVDQSSFSKCHTIADLSKVLHKLSGIVVEARSLAKEVLLASVDCLLYVDTKHNSVSVHISCLKTLRKIIATFHFKPDSYPGEVLDVEVKKGLGDVRVEEIKNQLTSVEPGPDYFTRLLAAVNLG
ncbi:hypothetical protein ScPMuIL_013885 [Solemya velum]